MSSKTAATRPSKRKSAALAGLAKCLSSPGAGGGAAGSRGAMEAAGLCGMGGFRARMDGDAARVHGTAAGEQELARHPMKGT